MKAFQVPVTINNEPMVLDFSRYTVNKQRGIQILCANGSPYARLTTNVEAYVLPDDYILIREDQPGADIVQAIVDAGIITDTGIRVPVGYARGGIYAVMYEPTTADEYNQ